MLDKSGMDSWAMVSMTETSVSGGVYTYNVNVVMPLFTAVVGAERQTYFYINAGNLQHRVLLQQWGGDGVWITADVQLDSSDNYGTGIMQRRKIVFTSGSPGTWEWEVEEDGSCVAVPGIYEISAGGQQPDDRSTKLTGKRTERIEIARCGEKTGVDY